MTESNPVAVACIPVFNDDTTMCRVVVRALRCVDGVVVCDDG